MPLLSIGRIPLLLDCNLFPPCAFGLTNRKDFDAMHLKRDRTARPRRLNHAGPRTGPGKVV
jgi:hypothetical protein